MATENNKLTLWKSSIQVLLSKLYGPQGTFYFTSHSPGEHIICLESNSTRLVSFGGSKLVSARPTSRLLSTVSALFRRDIGMQSRDTRAGSKPIKVLRPDLGAAATEGAWTGFRGAPPG